MSVADKPATTGPLSSRLTLVGVIVAAIIPLLWPGDVPFINDEPQLILNAVIASAGGHLAPMGLQGTFGLAYGPLPTWVYQALLLITHDVVIVAALHIVLMTAVTGAALWWLARSLGLWRGFVAVPLLSPYFWFYARAVWDNTFLLPLGALALAGYAAFLSTRSSTGLRVAVAAMLAIPLVHLMGLSLIAPLALHMLVVHRRALWAHKGSLLGLAAAAIWMAWPYWQYLLAPRPATPPPERVAAGWLFPLFGARLLGARELAYFFGVEPVSGSPFALTDGLSAIAYGLAWLGIVIALALLMRAATARRWSAHAHVMVIAITALAVQSLVHGLSAKFEHPHYQNGTWIATVLLAWTAVDWLQRRGPALRLAGLAATSLLAAGNVIAALALATSLHRSHGTREVYGPTLGNQQQVARELARYAPTSEVQNRVLAWERFPHALDTLRQLNAAKRIDLPRRVLRLQYASDDPRDGLVRVGDGDAAR